MARFAPQKNDVLDAIARELLQNYGKGRVIVAIDGLSHTVTAPFADDLAEALRRAGHVVFRASMRNFLYPPTLLYPAGSDPQPTGYDLGTFHRVLVDPFRNAGAGSFVLSAFDPDRGVAVASKWTTAKPDSILIIDGELLHDPELRGLWHFSLWLDTGGSATPVEAKYLKRVKPAATASAIVDVTDPDHPRRVFADSC